MKNGSSTTIEYAFSQIDQDSKSIIDGIADLEYKAKANKALRKLYEESSKNSDGKKNKSGHKDLDLKELMNGYKNFLSSQGLALLTISDYAMEAERFLSHLAGKNIYIFMVSQANVEEYLSTARKERKLSINSYSKVVISLKRFLQFLKERDIIEIDAAKIKTPKKVKPIKEVLNREDVKRIKNYLKSRKEKFVGENIRDSVSLALMLRCGLRKSEIINLDWEDIDLNSNRIMVKDSKGGKSRSLYFKGSLKKVLKKYQKCLKIYRGAVIRGKCRRRISKASLENLVSRIFIEAKIYRKGLSIHSLRHYYADRLRRKKVDLQTISILLGHSRIDTTEVYLHVSEEDLKKAATI